MPTPVNTYVVANFSDRATLTPSTGDLVVITGPGVTQRYDGSAWVTLNDRWRDEVNPKDFADASWAGTIGVGAANLVTGAEITTHTEWRGRYYTSDTRDYVCLQEALYAAFAPGTTSSGDIVWNGSGSPQLNHDVRIPAGKYRISRPLWLVCAEGAKIRGAGRLSTVVQQDTSNAPVFWTDGLSYSHVEDITFQGNSSDTAATHSHRDAPLVDLNWFGDGGPNGSGTRAGVAGSTTSRPVASATVPYVEVAANTWTPDALVGEWVVVVDGTGRSDMPRKVLSNTATRIYIEGSWDVTPDNTSKFVVGGRPGTVCWASATTITDFLTDFSISPPSVGATVYAWDLAGTTFETTTLASYAKRTLSLTSSLTTIPKPNSSDADMGPSGSGRETGWRYCVDGTQYSASAASNDCTLTLASSLGTDNEYSGAFAEVISGPGTGQILPIRSHTGGVILFNDTADVYRNHWWSLPSSASSIAIRSRPSFDSGLQANTIMQVFTRYSAEVGMAYARAGNASMGSETIWENCHFEGFSLAGLMFRSANALGNQIIGGSFGNNPGYGIWSRAGEVRVQGTAFANGCGSQWGADFRSEAGHYVPYEFQWCRSESLNGPFTAESAESQLQVIGFHHNPSFSDYPISDYIAGMTAVVGDYYRPSTHDGAAYRCVSVTGDAVVGAEPTWSTTGGPSVLTSGAGSGGGTASFVRLDNFAVYGRDLLVQNSSVWYSLVGGANSLIAHEITTTRPNPFSFKILGVFAQMTNRFVIEGHICVLTAGAAGPPADVDHHPYYAATRGYADTGFVSASNALVILSGSLSTSYEDIALRHDGAGVDANGDLLLSVVDGPTKATVLGKAPASGTDAVGVDFVLAGGQGTGTGDGGTIRFQVAPKATTTGSGANVVVDGLTIASNKNVCFFGGRQASVTSPVVSGGAVTPDAAAGEICRVSASGNLTVNKPSNSAEGGLLVLDIKNSSAGAITVTLGTGFVGTFAGPSAGKRRTLPFAYDATAGVWVPLGSESPDL